MVEWYLDHMGMICEGGQVLMLGRWELLFVSGDSDWVEIFHGASQFYIIQDTQPYKK